MIGQLLSGRYRIIRTLAAGGMGQTYIAEDTQRPGNPKCVVKQLKPASGNTSFLATARRLFSREAEILEQLGHHDQIPRLLAYFEQDQEFYVIQEFIDGRPLSIELALEPRWTEAQVIQFLQEILRILEFVHSQNVIHRDIKPDNLIRRRRDRKFVLIDFGAVKQVRIQQLDAVGQTNTTISIGTPGYMPPEQSKGKPCPSSDIYALGMIAIRALTGIHPSDLPEDDSDGEVVWRDRAEVSDDLAMILTKMVRYYHKHRYQSATETLQALEPLIIATPFEEPYITTPEAYSQPSFLHSTSNGCASAHVVTDGQAASTPQMGAFVLSRMSQAERDELSTFVSPLASVNPGFPVASVSSSGRLLSAPVGSESFWRWNRWGVVAAVLGLIAGFSYLGYRYLPSQVLSRLQNFKAEENYDECIRQAGTPTVQGNPQVQTILGECQFGKAKQLAKWGRFKDAITMANKIAPQASIRQQAQQLISQWTKQILTIAEKEYENGNLNAAVAMAKAIPKESEFFKSAQESIARWNQEWKINEELLSHAQEALDKRQWRSAIAAANQVTTNYWVEQARSIIQMANAALSAANPSQIDLPQLTRQKPSQQSEQFPQTAPAPRPALGNQEEAPIFEVPSQDTPTSQPSSEQKTPTPAQSPEQDTPTPAQSPESKSPAPQQPSTQATPEPKAPAQNAPIIEIPDVFK